MHTDYKKRHINTEKRFYKKINKQKNFVITLAIAGLGSTLLFVQHLAIDKYKRIDLAIWTLIVVTLFFCQMLIGYSIFENERKKYI